MCAWKVVIHSDLNASVVVMPGFLGNYGKATVFGGPFEHIIDSFLNSIHFIPRVGI